MITSIIELLSDDSKSLTSALLKTQVLASRLDNAELKNWTTNELKGYRNTTLLPEYRVAKANPRCAISDDFNYMDNQPMPVTIFPKKISDFLISLPLKQGVKSLEQTASGEFGEYIVKDFGDDFSAWLTSEAQRNGQRIQLSNIRILVHIGEVVQALGEIRTRLLELMLELEKQYPDLDKQIEIKEVNKSEVNDKIIHIMSHVNITTTGDGNIINTGSHNTFNINTNINKGDTEALVKSLEELNISKDDIEEISSIVLSDPPIYETKTLGQKTRGWISKMINKTLDGTWDITTGTAGGLLTELFKSYFGL
ncbi:MAG: hypothetical protein C0446_13010 [Chitinophaga sp.]|nr:hypothetical protein [Chitinophaga sp.]